MSLKHFPRSPGAEPPLESFAKPPREPNCRERLLIPTDAANYLRLSPSWLAKARMRGDGPPYVKLGRSIRYREADLLHWMKARLRLSTSER
jgi:predicted DNA-binding transcriptional regulator AlpA